MTTILVVLFWVIVLLGLIAWGVRSLPLDATFKTIAYVVILIVLVVVLFSALGVVSFPLR